MFRSTLKPVNYAFRLLCIIALTTLPANADFEKLDDNEILISPSELHEETRNLRLLVRHNMVIAYALNKKSNSAWVIYEWGEGLRVCDLNDNGEVQSCYYHAPNN